MQEFASVSASSYDPAALAAKLTEKSAEGWSVVSIVPTGGDVTAFLVRDSSGTAATVAEPAAAVTPEPEPQPESSFAPVLTPMAVSTPEPTPAVAEPAGWGVAPEPAAPAMAPIVDPTPASTYQPTQTYQPAAQPVQTYQPAAQASPAVPAGWYADPAGRFELRYWDGSTWTEHVSRAGQQYTDPPVA
jgi:hypothetical protein